MGDENKLSAPVLRYERDTGKLHFYYGIYKDQEFSVGYWSNMFEKEGSQIYTPSDYREDMGDEVENVLLSDVILINGDYIFYGIAKHNDERYTAWSGTGDSWTDVRAETVLSNSSHPNVVGNLIQSPNVIELEGELLMSYTAGTNSDLVGERQIYLAVGNDYDSFEPTDKILVPHGDCGTWEERRTYAGQWLKRQSGSYLEPTTVDNKIRLYYSGHDLGTTSSSGNLGYTGLIEYSPEYLLEYV